jgi:hypothetical protein
MPYIGIKDNSNSNNNNNNNNKRWTGYVASMRDKRSVYRVLESKHEEKRPLGRPRRRWEDNIKMNL